MTSARLLGCAVCLWLFFAVVAPCVSSADVLPDPGVRPHQRIVETSPSNAKAVEPKVPARRAAQKATLSRDELWLYAMEGLSAFLIPLVLTLLIEVPVIAIAGRGTAAAWKVGVLTNTATNPAAVLSFLLMVPLLQQTSLRVSPLLPMFVIEAAVVVVEWRIFRRALGWSNRRAIAVALIANGLSFGVGLAIVGGFFGF